MGRRKTDPAALRTIGLFSGRTPLEEASSLLEEEPDAHEGRKAPVERNIVSEAEEAAVRWLGLDVFHEGDDIRILEHERGHAVVMLVDTSKTSTGSAYATRSFRLSKAQWAKLRQLIKERGG